MSDPTPTRLVPDELLPAAILITHHDNYGGQKVFRQGRGPLCFGNQEAQEAEMFERAERYRKLADAYEDLGYWLSEIDPEAVSS